MLKISIFFFLCRVKIITISNIHNASLVGCTNLRGIQSKWIKWSSNTCSAVKCFFFKSRLLVYLISFPDKIYQTFYLHRLFARCVRRDILLIEWEIIQSMMFSTSLFHNFILCLEDRSLKKLEMDFSRIFIGS